MEVYMIQFPTMIQHRNFSPNDHGKDSNNQIWVVNNISRFSSIGKHVRNNLEVTNNMSTYKN
jgi:hypothetical protein